MLPDNNQHTQGYVTTLSGQASNFDSITPIQCGLFLKHYGMGGGITLLFLKVEGQNLEAWGILMCFLQKWY